MRRGVACDRTYIVGEGFARDNFAAQKFRRGTVHPIWKFRKRGRQCSDPKPQISPDKPPCSRIHNRFTRKVPKSCQIVSGFGTRLLTGVKRMVQHALPLPTLTAFYGGTQYSAHRKFASVQQPYMLWGAHISLNLGHEDFDEHCLRLGIKTCPMLFQSHSRWTA